MRSAGRWLLQLVCAAGVASSLFAQSPGRGVNWDRVRQAAGPFRQVVDSAGLVEVDSNLPPGIDATDLPALCEARKQAVARARSKASESLRALGTGRDPISNERRAVVERYLGAVDSFAGDMPSAAQHFKAGVEALAPFVNEYPDLKAPYLGLIETLGTAYLRQGEIENCLINPGADQCLFPVRPGGVHRRSEGAQAAAREFEGYLQRDPDNLEVQWLLNISHMLLGEYPRGVPPRFLLKPEMFKSSIRLPRFVDVAPGIGVAKHGLAGGTIVDDFDGDGLLDIVLSSVEYCDPLSFFRNRGDGTFEDRSSAALLDGQLGGLNIIQTDFDNDGRLDIFVMRGGWEVPMRNSLLRNNPDGTFTDITEQAGLSSAAHATHSVAWADYDNDGWLDVFVGHELSRSQLFRNRGDGTFEDVTARSGIAAEAYTKGAVFGDYDNDGYPDLYLSNFFEENLLFHNNGNGTFTEVGRKLGVDRPLLSFPTWFFDYDNDGWLDLFVASYPASVEEFAKHYHGKPTTTETLTLYRNNGDGTFADATRDAHLSRVVPAMGSNFGDLDNDGYLDMYLGSGTPSFGSVMPNIMLKNEGGKRFVDVTEATGTGHLQKGHGVGFADLDNDGDEDVVLNAGGAVPGDAFEDAVFQNPGTPGTHWIAVKLGGVKSNRAAIGAKIRVVVRGGGGAKLRYREVTSGGSFGSNSLMQHIGLGKATAIESLEIEWPTSRTRQTFRNVPLDSFLEIRELDETFMVRPRPKFTLGGATSSHQH